MYTHKWIRVIDCSHYTFFFGWLVVVAFSWKQLRSCQAIKIIGKLELRSPCVVFFLSFLILIFSSHLKPVYNGFVWPMLSAYPIHCFLLLLLSKLKICQKNWWQYYCDWAMYVQVHQRHMRQVELLRHIGTRCTLFLRNYIFRSIHMTEQKLLTNILSCARTDCHELQLLTSIIFFSISVSSLLPFVRVADQCYC